MTTPKTSSPELSVSQASKEATHNEALRRIEAGAGHYLVVDKDLTAPPGSCADGATYIVGASATGTWASQDGNLAISVGANHANGWYFRTPEEGVTAYVQDENKLYLHDGAAWGEYVGKPVETLIVALGDENTAITAGNGKVTLRAPCAMTLTALPRASLSTAQATDGGGGILTVDINVTGGSILSTKLTIDNTEKTSTTAATPAVLSASTIADDAEITFDVDQIGDGTATGLKVVLTYRRT